MSLGDKKGILIYSSAESHGKSLIVTAGATCTIAVELSIYVITEGFSTSQSPKRNERRKHARRRGREDTMITTYRQLNP